MSRRRHCSRDPDTASAIRVALKSSAASASLTLAHIAGSVRCYTGDRESSPKFAPRIMRSSASGNRRRRACPRPEPSPVGIPETRRPWRAKMLSCLDPASSVRFVKGRGLVAITLATSSSAPNARLTPSNSSTSRTASGCRRTRPVMQREARTSRHARDVGSAAIACSSAG